MGNKKISEALEDMFETETEYINSRTKKQKKHRSGRFIAILISIVMSALIVGTLLYSFLEAILNN